MDAFYDRLIVRAATIDELLSDDFETLPGQKGDADLAGRRLAAWCRSCASGDWSLFGRRLERDGISIGRVLERFATVRRSAPAARPAWIDDAIWIEAALQSPARDATAAKVEGKSCAFEHLFVPLVEQAEARLWAGIEGLAGNLNAAGRASLRHALLDELCTLCAPALYERFAKARKATAKPADAAAPAAGATALYDQFVAEMKAAGFRRLFEDKPVLLRLIATITRQWIDTMREFVMRLDVDLPVIRGEILHSGTKSPVAGIEGDLSDPHNGGHSVKIVTFADGARVVYKPKDLRLDAGWHTLVEALNGSNAPVALRAVRTLSRDGYGWTEFIAHAGCADRESFKLFFRRAGAWLALFHCFAASDMHQENVIASGDHPVPIDLEMILQATAEEESIDEPEGKAFEAAMETVSNSVMMVGLLPAYGRSPDNSIFEIGGMTGEWNSGTKLAWNAINSDAMRPSKSVVAGDGVPNLPHADGETAKLGGHVGDLISGFEDYAVFLRRRTADSTQQSLFEGFAGLPVRKVIRPTRFYYMLLQRLKNHRSMEDGVLWSAQADFIARLADWDKDSDLIWPLQPAERVALIELNVPHFVSPSDGHEISNGAGISVRTGATSGIDRAVARVKSFDEADIAWQIDVIRQNTGSVMKSTGLTTRGAEMGKPLRPDFSASPTREAFAAEAGKIAEELSARAVRRGPGAAWIGLDWLGDSEVSQLVTLGPDLYNGHCGIAVFLAAHAGVTGSEASAALARAAVSHLRNNLKGRNAARVARSVGIGGATGLGSIVYSFALMSKALRDDDLLADAHLTVELFTDDLIAADKQLDFMAGSAGAILGLLRLYRDTQSSAALRRAVMCGEHLLAQSRVGPEGRRTWGQQAPLLGALNGMSHGAAGYAYALSSLSAATGRDDFAAAADECIAFENSTYDATRGNWPDLRSEDAQRTWPCQWCHGSPGIGLARIAATRRGGQSSERLLADVQGALEGAQRGWPQAVDTLCCGTFGNIEFFCEAGDALGRADIRDLAVRRLMSVLETSAATGDYRWSAGDRRFNLGLFRGLAGAGYTFLRRVDETLPNVLILE